MPVAKVMTKNRGRRRMRLSSGTPNVRPTLIKELMYALRVVRKLPLRAHKGREGEGGLVTTSAELVLYGDRRTPCTGALRAANDSSRVELMPPGVHPGIRRTKGTAVTCPAMGP